MAGKNITQINDPLVKVTPEYLFHAVRNPKPDIESAIRQLRLVKAIDKKKYQALKRSLPYIVAAIFHPQIRRTENFAWTNYFILDIDHLSDKELIAEEVKLRLSNDNRIKLIFTSPGEDGLKILFGIKDKFYDSAKYSLFYKAFAASFAVQYQLEQVTDKKTSDVTRACFISHDDKAVYNPDAELIAPEAYIDFENILQIKQLKADIKTEEKELARVQTEKPELEDEVLIKIKKTLNPEYRSKKEKQLFVPEEIESITEFIVSGMRENQIATIETRNINYGRKFKFILGKKQAEINIFYGKKGYTVVISPRNGTDKELNEVCSALISQWLI